MSNEYPRESELEEIRTWDTLSKGVTPLLEYVRWLWWESDSGFRLSGKRILKLQLHTWGWSGNEDIIVALQGNIIFWALAFQQERRGGHFWFRIDLKLMSPT